MNEDDIVASWSERVRAATASNTPLRIRGGGTKDWYGQTLQGEILDTRAYRGIIEYDPAELVITAKAGTPLREIEARLDECGQMLPFEPPHFGHDATLGGCIAAGLAGPRRAAAGAPRDFVLGAVVMNGQGQVLHFGGQVVKNVAGYDVSRLLAGSLGTLGLILEVSVKVLPKPVAEATLKFEMNDTDAVRKLNEWGGHPLPLTGSAWRDHTLAVAARRRGSRGEIGAHVAGRRSGRRRRSRAFLVRLARTVRSVLRRTAAEIGVVAPLVAIDCRADASPRPAPDGMGRRATLVDHRRRRADRAHQREAGRRPRDHLPFGRGVRPQRRRVHTLARADDEDSSRPESRIRSRAYFQSRPSLPRLLS